MQQLRQIGNLMKDDFQKSFEEKHKINIESQNREVPFSYKFFTNELCEFYPCHDMKHINCLFCRCPAYHDDCCPGIVKGYGVIILENGVKDCSGCVYNHEPCNYEEMMYYNT